MYSSFFQSEFLQFFPVFYSRKSFVFYSNESSIGDFTVCSKRNSRRCFMQNIFILRFIVVLFYTTVLRCITSISLLLTSVKASFCVKPRNCIFCGMFELFENENTSNSFFKKISSQSIPHFKDLKITFCWFD